MNSEVTRRTLVIIDTDPGVDDVLALLLALASPEIEIIAIIACYGNADIEACYLNVFRVFRAVERHLAVHPEDAVRFPNFDPDKRPILVRGSAAPIKDEDKYLAQPFFYKDGLGDVSTRYPAHDAGCDLSAEAERYFRVSTSSAADVTLDLLRDHPARSITYMALGPMTDLHHTLQQDAALFRERIGRVVCMGGALDVPGNTSANAEFNWFADPWAVKDLLMQPGQGIPLERFLLLPLDITMSHELPFPLYQEHVDTALDTTARPLDREGKPPLHHWTSCFLQKSREFMREFGKDVVELHDPAALWCAIANPLAANVEGCEPQLGPGWHAVRRIFDIERKVYNPPPPLQKLWLTEVFSTGELTRGMCVVDRRMDEGAYELGANRALVQAELEREVTPLVAPAAVQVQTAAAMCDSENAPDSTGAEFDTDANTATSAAGIWCIDRTPGPAALLTLMLERVWGVEDFAL